MHSQIDITNVPENDIDVWKMIGEGRVKGCFQIESHLGKTWCQKLKPENMTELAALISIIRPGTLKSIVDGKSMTQHFVDRKHGKEDIPSLHPSIDDLLQETYGVIVYQEQAMEISVRMAGFDLKEADNLRKAIGKKKADLMKEVRGKFLEGCVKNKIDNSKAEDIFDMIEKSARYSFNKCLDPSSVVETKSGYKLMSDLKIGDYVLGPTENGDEFLKVLDVIDCGEKELYEVEFDTGDKISCTLDHKFLCNDGKKHKLSEILESDLDIKGHIRRRAMRSAKIIGIKKIGVKKSMDIEVNSNEHVFYANNIATSNSHAVAYAKMAYWSAWTRHHYPEKFFKNWLRNADEKIDPDLEKRQLIMSAKSEDIEIRGPNINILEENFSWKNGCIYFGICNVKNVGKAHLNQLIEGFKNLEGKKTWGNILVNILPFVNKKAIENLIKTGAFTGFGKSRNEMLHEYHCYLDLTKKEMQAIKENIKCDGSLSDILNKFISYGLKKNGGFISTAGRFDKINNILTRINNPGRNLADNGMIYAKTEEKLLGYSINHSELNSCSEAANANTTCKQINDGKKDNSIIAVIIKRIREHKTKNGDTMAFLSVEDESGELENVVVFPDIYEQNKDIMYEQATVLMSGEIQDKQRNSFIVDKVFSI